ncbi:MAG: glycosyltransferase [Bacteroidales bacterium]|jgi:glycosyltransferase involved in cell wall biosynthesis|nr:glycosyltransferase [Bacteroidales bacterium]
MKIIIAGVAYPYRGGLAAYNERLAREFIAEQHEVSIVTFTLQYPSFLFPGKSQYVNSMLPEGLSITRRMNSTNPFNWIKTARYIRSQKPDILIFKFWLPFMGPCFGTIARVVRKNKRTKVISIFDNVIPHEKRPGDKLFTRYYTGAIDGAIAMSQSVMDDITLFRKDIPVRLNPHPVFDNFGPSISRSNAMASLGLDDSCSYMLFFGFIRKYKGLDLLIDAFADSRLRNRNIKLIVAGEFYDDAEYYTGKVKEHALESEVIFFDRFINDSEVTAFFSAADIVVQPYRSATQSGVTQIAYNFCKPMIVTDTGGLRETVPHQRCGYVVNPEPGSISDAIADFFINNRKEEFAINVLHEKHKYAWSAMTAALTDVYNKITGK